MWARVVGFLLLGYLSMSRSFAYLGIPPLKLFIGELALGTFLITHPRSILGRWFAALIRPSLVSGIAWGIFTLLGYGLFQVLRGIGLGHSPVTALQNLGFNYYPLYLYLGLWVGLRYPGFLPKFVRVLAWWNGLYGIAYILVLNRLPWTIPGSPQVPLFGQPGGSAVAMLGLLAFEPHLVRIWPPLLLNAFVLLGVSVRAEWLGFLIGLSLLGWRAKRLGRIAMGVMAVVLLLSFMYLIDFSLPAPAYRGGSISVQDTIGRAVAPLNPELAAQYTEHADIFAGTISWRMHWWRSIWTSVHENPVRILLGYGYGFPIADLVPYLEGQAIRTPHNVFLYALGYGGWLEVELFFAFQLFLGHLLWRAYRFTGQPFGMVIWAMSLAGAFFGNFFETPFGAIPFYLLLGLAAAPALRARRTAYACFSRA